MAEIIIIDVSPRIQAIAGASQTVFTYNFPVFDEGDLAVYQTPVGQSPDDAADILALNADYTVQGVSAQGGGTITLTVGATSGDLITIERNMPLERLSDYNDAGSFTAASVNRDYDRDVMMTQQVNTKIEKRSLLYRHTEMIPPGLNILPKLGASQFWKSAADGNSLLAVTLEESAGWSALRSELSSQTQLAPGAALVGYYDSKDAGMTVNTKLNSLSTYLNNISNRNLIIGGDFGLNPWQRGIGFANVANNQYTADRFKVIKNLATGAATIARQPDSPSIAQAGFYSPYSLIVDISTAQASIAAGEYFAIAHLIEGYNFTRIAQRPFVFSFWVKANVTGIYCCAFRNSGKDRSYVTEFTVNAINVWELKTISVPASPSAGTWNYGNGVGLEVLIVKACGSTFITGTPNVWQTGNFLATANQTNLFTSISNEFNTNLYQVEAGTARTQFELRTFDEELAKCQRYYAKTYALGVYPGATDAEEYLIEHSTSTDPDTLFFNWQLPVRARAAGTAVVYSPKTGGANAIHNQTGVVDSAASAASGEINDRATNTGGIVDNNTYTAHFTHDAEL